MKKRALARLVEVVVESCKGGEKAHLSVLQVQADPTGEAQALGEELKSKVHVSHIPIYELPPAIVFHAGPKAMGVGFFVEQVVLAIHIAVKKSLPYDRNGIIFGLIA